MFPKLAELHAIDFDDLPLTIKFTNCDWWNWNTACPLIHLETAWGGGNKTAIAEALNISINAVDGEYEWAAELVKSRLVIIFSFMRPFTNFIISIYF